MEDESASKMDEIEETSPLLGSAANTAADKGPEIEVHLYRQGKGPIKVFKSALGGYDQDQLEVRELLLQYDFKAIYAYNPSSGRGVPIRFHPKNGRSLLPYKDGTIIHVDGEPQDPLLKPITKVLVGTAIIVILITIVYSKKPTWVNKFKFSGSGIPPWLIACAVIVFTRLSKRTKDFLTSRR